MLRPRLLCIALSLCTGACVVPDPVPSYLPAWEPFDPQEGGWATTRPVLIAADCQFHNLLSKPVPERNLSAEAAVATAIRPPQLDLFSRDVLSWVLREGAPETQATLFLGDALNLACEGEFETFVEVMSGSGKPWFLAPGNHDAYYFGVFQPERAGLWEDACHGAGRPVDKALLIRLYVAALLGQEGPGFDALARALDLENARDLPLDARAGLIPSAFDWLAPAGAPGILDGICWEIDDLRPWRSFILQSVDLSHPGEGSLGTHALLLDSCQYGRRPDMLPNAWASYPLGLNCGYTGEMLPNQLRKVRNWVEENREQTGFVLMCHHPFDSIAPRAKSSLGWIWREKSVSILVTAHTHSGYFVHHDLGGETDELELNLGSTTDWPMEWRTLVAYRNPEKQQVYIRTDRHTLVEALTNREGYFLQGWEVPLDAPDDYRKYKQGSSAGGVLAGIYYAYSLVPYWLPQPRMRPSRAARRTEAQVKDTMLWTYQRLLQAFPTHPDQGQPVWPQGCDTDHEVSERILALTGMEEGMAMKTDLLVELEVFERTRSSWDPTSQTTTDDIRERFKISQAAWASRFEQSRGRLLNVEDELIRVDWEKMVDKSNRR